jgi:RnfABCDGE-type electron transport complex G subunit
MGKFVRLTVVLAVVAGAAAAALSLTYSGTKERIGAQDKERKKKALKEVFFWLSDPKVEPVSDDDGPMKVFAKAGDALPSYYAAEGKASGYNASVPIQVLVGFTNPQHGSVPQQKGKTGFVVVGWKVVNSEETPGLGEKAKDTEASSTWLEGGPFAGPKPDHDSRTAFQRQFSGRTIAEILLKKDGGTLDAIPAATITSRGIVQAIRNAETTLKNAIASARKEP